MLTKFETKLYRQIVDSNFFLFLEKKSLTLKYLDTQNLLKTVKQFLRLLSSLRQQKNQGKEQAIYIVIQTSDAYSLHIIKCFLARYSMPVQIVLQSTVNLPKQPRMLLLLKDLTYTKQQSLTNAIFQDKLYLVQQVSLSPTSRSSGFYCIFNETLTLKKLLFIFILIYKSF